MERHQNKLIQKTILQTTCNYLLTIKTRRMEGNFFDSIREGMIRTRENLQEKKTPVVITSYSQPHVLQQRMKEERLRHGDRVTANISPVRLESNVGKMIMYFCPMQGIEVTAKLAVGDGGSLPAEAIIDGFAVPANFKSGLYELKNVELYSNGTMQVLATENTTFEAV